MLYSRIASAAVQIQDAEEELSASATPGVLPSASAPPRRP